MPNPSMVCFITLVLSHYRVPFHERVRAILKRHDVDYRVIYSDPVGGDASKKDTLALPWAEKVPVHPLNVFGQPFFWQDVRDQARDADLSIVSQENKLLVNYWLQARYWLFGRKFGFFGHGRTASTSRFTLFARPLKRFLATRVHWWFAYTPEVADLLSGYGFPRERITINYNSIDTAALGDEIASVTEPEIEQFRERLGIPPGPLALNIGAIYEEKRIGFLIEAALIARRSIPDFQLLIVGAGPEAHIADAAAREHDFIHYAGPLFGRDKAIALKASRACLLPGVIGLAVLDTFVGSCPPVATTVPGSGPEIDYLKDGENGLLVHDHTSPFAFASAIERVMIDDGLIERLRLGASDAARLYSIETMADRFAAGVLNALKTSAGNVRTA
ncbi:MAG: glycosyltransferase family 4 protein [Pseudomonadota bacterium]